LDWADVIVCEWFCNNAIWYSQNKRAGQKLIVRLHRFELYGQYPHKADFDKIDHVVFVGDYYRDEAITRLGWRAEKLTVIPNWVDVKLMNRSKVSGAFFNLGMIGIAPMRKRLDRGLDILEQLRSTDPRFQLYIKSKLPWEYPWIWQRPEEQDHYHEVFRRINETPILRGAVHFDPFGPEVGAWLRKIGFVLSTSDDESFHLAPAEGMASGALPMLLDWQGVEAIYPDKWIHGSCEEIVETVLATLADGSWTALGDEVREFIDTNYSVERVCGDWERLVLPS
jgi:glycosyltransferase involved in cell wall biosynthesis